jgi:hypothetical protein
MEMLTVFDYPVHGRKRSCHLHTIASRNRVKGAHIGIDE